MMFACKTLFMARKSLTFIHQTFINLYTFVRIAKNYFIFYWFFHLNNFTRFQNNLMDRFIVFFMFRVSVIVIVMSFLTVSMIMMMIMVMIMIFMSMLMMMNMVSMIMLVFLFIITLFMPMFLM